MIIVTHLFGRSYSRRELLDHVGDMSQLASIRRGRAIEGPEQGADQIEVYNASGLSFTLLPGRALDVASASYKGVPLAFRSATGDLGPGFYEPQGSGWLRGFFGGLTVSCGLTFTGHPEVDPEEENEELGLHGRLSYLPAYGVGTDAGWDGEQYRVRVTGKMRETAVFGTNLELSREISTVLGERTIRIRDRIWNRSVEPSPLMFVYHCNPGFPILDEGSRFLVNSERTTEWLEDREVGPDAYQTALGPQEEILDEVFVHRAKADGDGMVNVGLINDRLGLGLTWRYPLAQMPVLNQWRHFHRGTYVMGVEPGNVSMLGRAWNRREGYLTHIQPDEVREFDLEIGVLDGAEEIEEFESAI